MDLIQKKLIQQQIFYIAELNLHGNIQKIILMILL